MEIIGNSYFCGAGLLDSGLTSAGIKIGQAFECDKKAVKTYNLNFGHSIKQTDIREMLALDQDECDVMYFTYPCTKYSPIASISDSLTGDDLFLHALRHLAISRPEMYWVENVPGMKAFPVVMEAMTKMPDYYIQIFCPINASFWLPQDRNRLIIVGTRKNFNISPPENTRPITLKDILENDPEISIPQYVYNRIKGKYRDLPIISDPKKGDIAPTCVAHYAKDKGTRLIVDERFDFNLRPYTVREYARLQGLPDSFRFPVSESESYKQIGNGVPYQMGQWIGKETIRYFKYKNRVYL